MDFTSHKDLTGTDLHEPKPHAASHTNGVDDIQSATASQKGLMTAVQATDLDGVKAEVEAARGEYDDLNGRLGDISTVIVEQIGIFSPAHYARRSSPAILSSSSAAGRRTLVTPDDLALELDGFPRTIPQTSLDLDVSANWDSAYTSYATAANRAGEDIYLYATVAGLILSPNSTVPTGYTADNSRKIIGLSILPPYFVSATDKTPILTALPELAISHPAYGFMAGNIIPTSIWDLINRPKCSPEGMCKLSQAPGWWCDIYKQSGTGSSTRSEWNATCTKSRTWGDTGDDLGAVSKVMLTDLLWQLAMAGCPEGVNVAGSVDPVTSGLYLMTNGKPNISNDFVIGGPGEGYEWLDTQSSKSLAVSALATEPAFAYTDLQSKGSIYTQGADVKLLAGGYWSGGLNCGSRCRAANRARWAIIPSIGSRGCCQNTGGRV